MSPLLRFCLIVFVVVIMGMVSYEPRGAQPVFAQTTTVQYIAPGERLLLSVDQPNATWRLLSGGGSVTPEGLVTAPLVSDTLRLQSGVRTVEVRVREWSPLGLTALTSGTVQALAFGPDRRLYVATATGLYAMDLQAPGVWDAQRLGGVKSSYVTSLAFDGDGNVLIATTKGVYRRLSGQTAWTALQNGLPDTLADREASQIVIRERVMYAAFENGAIYRMPTVGNTWEAVGRTPPVANATIYSLAFDPQGRLYAGAETVYRYDDPTRLDGAWVAINATISAVNDRLPTERVLGLSFAQGTLYAGVRNRGAYRYDGRAWVRDHQHRGIPFEVGNQTFRPGSQYESAVILQSTANGWESVTQDMAALPRSGVSHAVADANGAFFVVGNNGEIYRSRRGIASAAAAPVIDAVFTTSAAFELPVGASTMLAANAVAQAAPSAGNLRIYMPLSRRGGDTVFRGSDLLDVLWRSANTTVASVDARGVVTAHAPGTVTLTAVSRTDPAKRADVQLTVITSQPVVTAVTISSGPTLELVTEATRAVFARVDGRFLGDQVGVQWLSTNPAVATISAQGIIQALTPGTTTIRASANADPSKQATISVTVTPSSVATLPGAGRWVNITANLPTDPRDASRTVGVTALIMHNNALIAGTDRRGIWRWNGTSWEQIGQLGNNQASVSRLLVGSDNRLYALSWRTVERLETNGSWTRLPTIEQQTLETLYEVNGTLYTMVHLGRQPDQLSATQLYRLEAAANAWQPLGQPFRYTSREPTGMLPVGAQIYLTAFDGRLYRMPLVGGVWVDDSTGLALPPAYNPADSMATGLAVASDGTMYVSVDRTRPKWYRRAVGDTSWTKFMGYTYGLGVNENATLINDLLHISAGNKVVRFRGTQRVTLGEHLGSLPDIRIQAITGSADGTLVYAGGVDANDSKTLGRAVYMIAPDPNAPVEDINLQVSTASYLRNGVDADALNAAEIGLDGTVILAGVSERSNAAGTEETLFGVRPTNLLGVDDGIIVRLDSSGRQVLTVTRIGAEVVDLELNRSNGQIVVGTDLGVSVLSAAADRVIWHQPIGAVKRVAIGSNGTVAVIQGTTVKTFDILGRLVGTRTVDGAFVEDVAVDGASGLVFIAGYRNQVLPYGLPVQVAYLDAYPLSLAALQWRNWGFNGKDLSEATAADTRGYRVAIGRDNRLYFLGENAGGNSIFQYDPRNQNIKRNTKQYDIYNQPVQTASAHFAYYAQFNPATGELFQHQVAIPRLSDGTSNTFRARAITADEHGYVYVGGTTAAAINNRDILQINGRTLAPYAGGDGTILVVSPDFGTRLIWTTWSNGGKHDTEITGLAAANGIATMAATARSGSLVTVQPLAGQASASPALAPGNPDGFFSVWGGFLKR
jgi:hypothetical protein